MCVCVVAVKCGFWASGKGDSMLLLLLQATKCCRQKGSLLLWRNI